MAIEGLTGAQARIQQNDGRGALVWLRALRSEPRFSPAELSLSLHLQGLVEFSLDDKDTAVETLSQAAEMERSSGWSLCAGHTDHQIALLTSSEGSIDYLGSHYKESLEELRRTKNTQGAGLCLRSLGKLAWLSGREDQAATFWRSGATSLERCGLAESEQLRVWIQAIWPPAVHPG